ncbi:hypothetical protein [Lewinella sp. IMCC34183]|uniref:hypothetical protein n=1 Tax=Lewinella sp. IMCC34183 TaxID=2248762 RepID=UPI000E272B9F|nr:hypothetical protein [Lewinella sp. IMCC34183]
MTFSILSYEVFWDTDNNRGGVDLALTGGQLIRLTTDRPEVLTCWNGLLKGPCPHYFSELGTAGICTIAHPALRPIGPPLRVPGGSGRRA